MSNLIKFLAVIVLLTSCKKLLDKPFQSKCKIQTIVSYGPQGLANPPIIASFEYTRWGAPLAVHVTDRGTGNPDYYFLYDKSRRLTGFIQGFDRPDLHDTAFHQYHKYIYNGNFITGDSVFGESSISDRYANGYSLGTYSYDAYGRIIKYTLYDPIGDFTVTHDYDYSGQDPFAKNTSILGGDPVLMFVNRDYRTSNDALEYNKFGFPTKFEQYTGGPIGPKSYLFADFLLVNEVIYDCDAPHRSNN